MEFRPNLDSLLTLTEAAAELNLEVSYVRRLVERGRIPAKKMNDYIWITTRDDLEEFKQQRRARGFAVSRKAPKLADFRISVNVRVFDIEHTREGFEKMKHLIAERAIAEFERLLVHKGVVVDGAG